MSKRQSLIFTYWQRRLSIGEALCQHAKECTDLEEGATHLANAVDHFTELCKDMRNLAIALERRGYPNGKAVAHHAGQVHELVKSTTNTLMDWRARID